MAAVLIVGGAIASCLTLAGFAGGLWWRFDLVCHFRVQYFLSLVGIAVVLGLLRKVRTAAVFAAFAVVNFLTVLPLYVGDGPANEDIPYALRVVSINVRTASRHFQKVDALIKEHNPDLVLLIEVNEKWLEAVTSLKETHPYSITRPRPDNFGIALFSKVPFAKSEIVHLGEAQVPSVVAEVAVDDRVFTIFGTHLLPPMSRAASRRRNGQLAAAAAFLKDVGAPVILLGDLNVTPWSVYFQRLLKEAGLRDSSRGWGFQPTWPTYHPLFLIPIDHCLYSQGIEITKRQTGPDVGSDHYPLIVDFHVSAR